MEGRLCVAEWLSVCGGMSPILEMKEKEGLLVGSSCVINEIFAMRDELIG